MVFPSWLRPCAAMVFVAGVLGLGSGCKKASEPAGTVTVSGYVNFNRVPMVYGTDGRPTGLGAAGAAVPARDVAVRVFQLSYGTGPDGITRQTWRLAGSTVTDTNGFYSFAGVVRSGFSTFVEVDSIFQQPIGNLSTIQVIADKDGIGSALPIGKRPIYAYRLDAAGQQVPDPVSTLAKDSTSVVAVIHGDTGVNFTLGSGSTWATTVPDWYTPGSNPDPDQPQSHPIEKAVPAGASILGILDSAYTFAYWYGDPTPSHGRGGVFDLHYYPGRTESPRRSFVVYDRSLTPLSFDSVKNLSHYFGSLAGGSADLTAADDAWDQGVIFPMLARNFLFGQGKTALFPTGPDGPDNEAPDLAVVDGLADAMAASLLATPFLTDTSSTDAAPLVIRDIRTIPAHPGIGSPKALAALAWQLTLQGNGIVQPGDFTSTGTHDAWVQGLNNPSVMARFFNLILPYTTYTEVHGTAVTAQDICSIFAQAGRLQEAMASGEPKDLHLIFPDVSLAPTLLHFLGPQIWPRSAGLTLAVDWDGTTSNPNLPGPLLDTLPPITLSMADAVQIQDPQIAHTGTVFPNSSLGEVAYAKLACGLDLNLRLSITTVPALPPDAAIEVVMDPAADAKAVPVFLQPQTFRFTAGALGPVDFTLRGNPTDLTNPLRHWVRVRMISPATRQPDVQITVSLLTLP